MAEKNSKINLKTNVTAKFRSRRFGFKNYFIKSQYAGTSMDSRQLARSSTLKPSLTIYAVDPLVPIELTDDTGRLLGLGQGILRYSNAKLGFCRARVIQPEGDYSETLIDFTAGDMQRVNLYSKKKISSPTLQSMIDRLNLGVTSQNELLIPDMDPLMFPQTVDDYDARRRSYDQKGTLS